MGEITHRKYLWKNKKNLVWACFYLVLTDMTVFAFPLVTKWVIDALQGESLPSFFPTELAAMSAFDFSVLLCSVLFILSILAAIFRYGWRHHLILSFFQTMHEVRKEIFSQLVKLPQSFFKKNRSGDLLSTLSEDTEKLRLTLAFGTLAVLDTVFNFLIFPWMLFWLHTELTFIILPFLILSGLVLIFLSARLTDIYEHVQDLIGGVSARAFELASGVRVIKSFAREKRMKELFEKQSQEMADEAILLAKYESAFIPCLKLVIGLATAFVLFYGGFLVMEGAWLVSSLVAYILYLGKLDWPVVALAWFAEVYRSSRASLKRINKVMNHPIEKAQPASATGDAGFVFEARELALRYNENVVLKNLRFQLKPREWLAITGPVGGGKSSLLNIFAGLERSYEGDLFFEGKELRSIESQEFQEKALFIPQDVYLFSKSIRRNLTFGEQKKLSDAQLEELLASLGFYLDNLQSRGGLYTPLGEKGLNVSGGQKQRLALARGLLRERDVYLFDDIFSHVDAETEQKLLKLLRKKIPAQASVVMVSQRLETLSEFDRVMVLANSEIEFLGPLNEGRKQSAFIHRLEYLQRKYQESA